MPGPNGRIGLALEHDGTKVDYLATRSSVRAWLAGLMITVPGAISPHRVQGSSVRKVTPNGQAKGPPEAVPLGRSVRRDNGEDGELGQFLSFLDAQMEAHPGWVEPADEDQLDRLAKLLANVKV